MGDKPQLRIVATKKDDKTDGTLVIDESRAFSPEMQAAVREMGREADRRRMGEGPNEGWDLTSPAAQRDDVLEAPRVKRGDAVRAATVWRRAR